ncbi:GNAT family N-acetyltransferase [Bacillaceae bacterium SIJ1]|uniref:GNAT family N-acetyltransferase n=1 Tax=Litoribacterium kuwaitense TaxID=1398745 RepID=UPI0013EDC772|nr:GNAT family N-acetyltransferase [Litoribacterium kuwaitense]NGP44263.1 GNAT family N-acetyltransferase [Litoribacterium kuwaitense]
MSDLTSLIIKELTTERELTDAFPIMKQLRPQHDLQAYLELVIEAQEKENYQMKALYDQGDIVAVIGFMPMTTLYYGRFIWVCDFVTASTKRSKGYGDKLLTYVHELAKEHGYACVALSSGLQRADAHRFYEEKMGYDRASYVFKKELQE